MKRRKEDELLNEGLIDAELAAEEEEIKSRKFKYGTLATVFTIIFIVAVILVNVLLGYMTKRFVWEFDIHSPVLLLRMMTSLSSPICARRSKKLMPLAMA